MAKGNWRDDVKRTLLDILKRKGVGSFLETAVAALGVDAHGDGISKAQFVGEVCEVVMFGLTREYLKASGHEAKIFHSVVLKDLQNPKSNFRTECDFVIVSPGFVLTTECKSYSGTVTITGDCTLSNSRTETNVYSQSRLHFDKLYLYCQQAVLPGMALPRVPVFANAFVFSNAELVDKRTTTQASKLRVLTTYDLFDYYDALFSKYPRKVYDYEKLCKVFGLASRSKKLHGEHADFVGY